MSVIAEIPRRDGGARPRRIGCRLLADYASDEHSETIYVALNPLLTEVILGPAELHRFTLIEMGEVRQIKSDATRIIHQRLCAWIDPGKTRSVKIDTLIGYCYPGADGNYLRAEKDSTERMRRVAVRKAMAELSTLGWEVGEKAGVFSVGRPKATISPPKIERAST